MTSPAVGRGIPCRGMFVSSGGQVTVDIRGRAEAFDVVKPPFVTVQVRED